ncbi:hypothetical protein CPB84DRAFT_1769475 [Gymnopilus junonius]|uniref:Uncharacterized protein n=1 Tax=Gymnopilus junonius TaxID=109634 RepID=A0A9P5NS70_GYMJU|nr:hypothetical protein CPB84DRAFT_1769475 [Gymnopilus junonius]
MASNVSFFQGASNVSITGGSFSVHNGNKTVYDNSRHHSNINSGNTTIRRTQDAYNNYSTNLDNVDPRQIPRLQRTSQRDQGRSDTRTFQEYIPPQAPNPILHPQYLPPGSRTQNYDSLNTTHNDVRNVRNNYSTNYGVRPANARHGSAIDPAPSPQSKTDG